MRILQPEEMRQRGCEFCMDHYKEIVPINDGKVIRKRHTEHACPHDVCPFTALDGFDRYEDYVKSLGAFYVKFGKDGKPK